MTTLAGIDTDVDDDDTIRVQLDSVSAIELGAVMADGVIVTNTDSTIHSVNHGAQRIFGYTERELAGQPITILLPRSLMTLHRHWHDEFMRADNVVRTMAASGQHRQVVGIAKDGSEVPCRVAICKVTSQGILFGVALVKLESETAVPAAPVDAGRATQNRGDYSKVQIFEGLVGAVARQKVAAFMVATALAAGYVLVNLEHYITLYAQTQTTAPTHYSDFNNKDGMQ